MRVLNILVIFLLFFFFVVVVFFCVFFSEKISLGISARHRIHMKHQALFSSQNKSKEKVFSAVTGLGSLRVKCVMMMLS